jgi:hypothetical protein
MHFYFIAMLPNVENMDLSHTSMAWSYLLAELAWDAHSKTTLTGANDTRDKLHWPQKQLVAVQVMQQEFQEVQPSIESVLNPSRRVGSLPHVDCCKHN